MVYTEAMSLKCINRVTYMQQIFSNAIQLCNNNSMELVSVVLKSLMFYHATTFQIYCPVQYSKITHYLVHFGKTTMHVTGCEISCECENLCDLRQCPIQRLMRLYVESLVQQLRSGYIHRNDCIQQYEVVDVFGLQSGCTLFLRQQLKDKYQITFCTTLILEQILMFMYGSWLTTRLSIN